MNEDKYIDEENIMDILKEKVLNNSKVYEFVKNHNEEQNLDPLKLSGGVGAVFGREDYILMLQLGIPIGVDQCLDANGDIIDDGLTLDGKEPIEPTIHVYKPINSLEEYFRYQSDVEYYPHLIVNPKYLTKKQVRNIAYCLSISNLDCCFDIDTRNKLQLEIINAVPLKYPDAMKIFNKYFDISVQKKFIYDYGVGFNRFYFLSGLNRIVKDKTHISKKKGRDDNER